MQTFKNNVSKPGLWNANMGNEPIEMYDGMTSNEINQYTNAVMEEFNPEKILAIGAEYIQKVQEDHNIRVIEAEQRAEKAESELRNIKGRIQTNNEIMQRQHQSDQTEISSKNQEIERLNTEIQKLQQQVNRRDTFIETLKMKIASLRLVGLMGRGKAIEELAQIANNPIDR